MKVSQAIRSIKTQPELWTKTEEDDFIFCFEYESYEFFKLSACIGGRIKLINKSQNVHMVWEGDDAVGSQLWSSVIVHYVNTYIIGK